jgi:hypothetical protein
MQVTIVLHLGNYNRAHIFSPQWTFCSRHSRYGTSRCLSSRCRLLSPLGDPEQGKKKLDLEPWRLPDTYSGPHLEQVWLLHCTKVYLWTPLPHTDSCNPFPHKLSLHTNCTLHGHCPSAWGAPHGHLSNSLQCLSHMLSTGWLQCSLGHLSGGSRLGLLEDWGTSV